MISETGKRDWRAWEGRVQFFQEWLGKMSSRKGPVGSTRNGKKELDLLRSGRGGIRQKKQWSLLGGGRAKGQGGWNAAQERWSQRGRPRSTHGSLLCQAGKSGFGFGLQNGSEPLENPLGGRRRLGVEGDKQWLCATWDSPPSEGPISYLLVF